MLATVVALFALTSAPAATEIVLARFTHVGLDDTHVKRARAKLASELATADAKPTKSSSTLDDTCIAEPTCLKSAIGTARGALTLDILRIGPMVNITAELYDAEGNRIAIVEQATDTTAFEETGVLLGGEILDPLRALAPPVVVASPEPSTALVQPPDEATTTTSVDATPAEQPAPVQPEGFPVIPTAFMVSGGAVLAFGVVVGIVSLVGLISQAQVLQTPGTTTAEKDLALTLGRASIVGATVGVLGVAIGGAVAGVGLLVE